MFDLVRFDLFDSFDLLDLGRKQALLIPSSPFFCQPRDLRDLHPLLVTFGSLGSAAPPS